MGGFEFDLEVSWYGSGSEDGDVLPVKFNVKGIGHPSIPARRTGHPDTWTAADGGEIEDVKIFMNGARLVKTTEASLLDDDEFMDAVRETIWANR